MLPRIEMPCSVPVNLPTKGPVPLSSVRNDDDSNSILAVMMSTAPVVVLLNRHTAPLSPCGWTRSAICGCGWPAL